MAKGFKLITPQQALDLSLLLEGETKDGLKVNEYVAKKALQKVEERKDKKTTVRLPSWKDSDKLRLSSVPTEALFLLLSHGIEDKWYELELEVVMSFLMDLDLLVDEGGVNKVTALYLHLKASNDVHPFYTRIPGFEWMSKAFVGKVGRVGNNMIPTAKDMCLSSYIAYELRPLAFAEEVKSYIAAACVYRGLWALPSYLAFAQDKVYRLSDYRGLGITPEKVEAVREAAQAELADPDAIPDEPENEIDIQALHLVDLTVRVSAAIMAADNHVEEYLGELRDEEQ